MRARQVAAVMCWTVMLGGCASGTWEPATVPEESLMPPPPIPGEGTSEENAFFEDEPADEAAEPEDKEAPEKQAPEKQEPEQKAPETKAAEKASEKKAPDKKAPDKKATEKKAAGPSENKPAKAAAEPN